MKKKLYLQPVTDCYNTIIDTSILLNTSELKGKGSDNLSIGYGKEEDGEEIEISSNHTRVWDEMD